MKKIYYWVTYFILGIATLSLWLLPSVSFADGEDCNKFWGNCNVDKIKTIWTEEWPSSSLLDTVSRTINWILWILATIALIIVIYAWFKMLTSWWDSKWYDSWLKTLKNAALWLVIIWLAWSIVSAIIWFINNASNTWW